MRLKNKIFLGLGTLSLALASYGTFAINNNNIGALEPISLDSIVYTDYFYESQIIPSENNQEFASEVSYMIPEEKTIENNILEEEIERSYLENLPNRNSQDGRTRHLVEYGDMLNQIAREYAGPNASANEVYMMVRGIEDINSIPNINSLSVFSLLTIPKESNDPIDSILYENMDKEERIRFLERRTPVQANNYIEDFVEISKNIGIDPRISLAISWKESEFNENARAGYYNSDGRFIVTGQGIMQINPQVHAVSDNYRENIEYALGYFKDMYENIREATDSDQIALLRTFASYNAGPARINNLIASGDWDGRTIENMPIEETRIFLSKINDYLSHMDAYLFD
ncbi:MAG: transglycosylase SLT domain-containing protein [Candidatus Woesearchaeota archaeon]